MRTIEIKNEKLAKILSERAEIVKKVDKLNDERDALAVEINKLAYKMNALKDKTSPIIEKLTPSFELNQFEIVSKVYINKYNKPEVEIVDRVEEYKNALIEESKKDTK